MAHLGQSTETPKSLVPETVAAPQTQTASGLFPKGARPNVPFTVMWNPYKWGFTEKWNRGWFPSLSYFHHENGANGITNEGDLRMAILNLQERDFQLILQDDARLSKFKVTLFEGTPHERKITGNDYLQRWEIRTPPNVQTKIYHYREVWARPYLMRKATKWIKDEVAYAKWLKFLVESGVVAPIDEVIKEHHIGKLEGRVKRIQQDYTKNPIPLIASRLEDQTRILYMMRGEDPDEAALESSQFIAQAREVLTGKIGQKPKGGK